MQKYNHSKLLEIALESTKTPQELKALYEETSNHSITLPQIRKILSRAGVKYASPYMSDETGLKLLTDYNNGMSINDLILKYNKNTEKQLRSTVERFSKKLNLRLNRNGGRIPWNELKEEFIDAWNTSHTIKEVADKLGVDFDRVFAQFQRKNQEWNLTAKDKTSVPWTKEEDTKLKKAVDEFYPFNTGKKESKYKKIQELYFPERTVYALQGRVRKLGLNTLIDMTQWSEEDCLNHIKQYPSSDFYRIAANNNLSMPRLSYLLSAYSKNRSWGEVLDYFGLPKNLGFDINKPCNLYYICIDEYWYKIGITTLDLYSRFGASQLKRIREIYTHTFTTGHEAIELETSIKKEFYSLFRDDLDVLKNGNTEIVDFDFLELDNNLTW
jgi:hypothetical protein